jgi:hypothetical protein
MDVISFLPIATYCMPTRTKRQPVNGSKTRTGTVFKTQTPVRYESVYQANFNYRRPGHISSITMKSQNLLSPVFGYPGKKAGACVCSLCTEMGITGHLWATGETRLSPFDG